MICASSWFSALANGLPFGPARGAGLLHGMGLFAPLGRFADSSRSARIHSMLSELFRVNHLFNSHGYAKLYVAARAGRAILRKPK